MSGVRVKVGSATVDLDALEWSNQGDATAQHYDLDELLHAVNRVVLATAAQADADALSSLLTACRFIIRKEFDREKLPDNVLALLTVLGR